jgi:hypothetical protein
MDLITYNWTAEYRKRHTYIQKTFCHGRLNLKNTSHGLTFEELDMNKKNLSMNVKKKCTQQK